VSGGRVALAGVVSYLDAYLRVGEVPDDANALNGLQVENRGWVSRLVAAVDASQATIEGLGAPGSPEDFPFLLVHHGLFWDGNQPVTGRRYRRLRGLFERNAALYAAHIPLDVHPEVGNNAVLARRLGLTSVQPFGLHKGITIGVSGIPPVDAETRGGLLALLAGALAIRPEAIRVIPGGPERVGRVGIITGGAGSAISQARAAGCDTFITGEGAAHTFFDAMEGDITVLYAGHYATETVGVQAAAEHVAGRFGLPWEFHDHPTGL
jgi:dinuclear metal center YbgI/SA1388 family protein